MPASAGLGARPTQRSGFAAFRVADELLLLPPEGDHAHALNESGAAVWSLCDGLHTPLDMLRALQARYDGDEVAMLADVTDALLRFHGVGLIDLAAPATNVRDGDDAVARVDRRPRVRFVFGIEDKPYFHWQLAILFESLAGELVRGWDATVIVCNDGADLSPELAHVLDVYGVRAITGTNHQRSFDIDYAGGRGGYAPLNRVEALKAIAPHVEADDVVCLMDTDIFLYGGLRPELFPSGNAVGSTPLLADPLFMGFGSTERGIDLAKLLAAIGCTTHLARGGVCVFMTGATVRNAKVIADCFRFAQILYQLGKVANLSDHNVWVAEVACFALALAQAGIDCALLDAPQFAVPLPQQSSVAPGTFFHYYADVNDGQGGPFAGSAWNKQLFRDRDLLREDIESFLAVARTGIEQCFFELALAARARLHGTAR